MLSRDQILNAKDIVTQEVDCPEWGGSVLVRSLSIEEASVWRKSMLVRKAVRNGNGQPTVDYVFDRGAAEHSNERLLSIACIDETGARLFSDADVQALAKKSVAPIERIALVVLQISGMTQKAAEDAEKNSEPSPSESISTD